MISAQMAICTTGRQLLPTGAVALAALSAAAAKCASTTLWRPRLPWLQLSGTMKQMMVHLPALWHKATSPLAGAAMSAATSGVHHLVSGSARRRLAAPNAVIMQGPRRLSIQPLQTPSILEQEFAWQNGTKNATHLGDSEKPQADILALHQMPRRARAQLACTT